MLTPHPDPARYYRKGADPTPWQDIGVDKQATVDLSERDKAYREAHPDRKILAVAGSCVVDNATLLANARIAMRIGYQEIEKPQDPFFTTPLVVVGSGLSVVPFLEEIREKAKTLPVLALKGAHNWLLEHGIVPTFACALDPQQARAKCFKDPRDDVVYLLASTVHPDTWVHLSGKKVMLFHQYFCKEQRDLPEWQDKTLLTGGCSTGTRALPLMYFCGFRHFQLYGYDSCVAPDQTYKLEGVQVKNGSEVFPVYVGEKEFHTTTSLYAQVQDLRGVLWSMPGCTVEAYGEGIFQEVLREGKAAGWPV